MRLTWKRARIDAVIPAPGTVHLAVQLRLWPHHRVHPALEGLQGSQRQCGRRVVPHRLQQQRRGLGTDLAHLVQHQEPAFFVADHQRIRQFDAISGQGLQSHDGLLEQAVLARKHQELLGVARARKRPQPRSATAAENDGSY